MQGYDYSHSGAYFVTICTQNRTCLFGPVVDGVMVLNDAGWMVQTVWDEMPQYYTCIETDEFVIMPNHIHGIVVLVGEPPRGRPDSMYCTDGGNRTDSGQAQGPAPTLSLPDVVHRFKTMTTKRYTDGVKLSGWQPFPGKLWQRNYYERIIRNETELNKIRQYIVNNPLNWQTDENYNG